MAIDLVVSRYGVEISKKHDCIMVSTPDTTDYYIPNQINSLIILTSTCKVSSGALTLLATNGLPVFFLRGGSLEATLVPMSRNSGEKVRLAQLAAKGSQQGTMLAREILRGKLLNQASNLRSLTRWRRGNRVSYRESLFDAVREIRRLAGLIRSVPHDEHSSWTARLFNLEARAAACYWQALRKAIPEELEFTSRIRRGATDPVNSAINYSYAILSTKVLHCMLSAGLDPHIGVLHTSRKGRAAFLYDCIEQFRPYIADRPLIGWLTRGGVPEVEGDRLQSSTRTKLVKLVMMKAQSRAPFRGERVKTVDIMKNKMQEIRAALLGVGSFRSYVWPW